LFSPFCTTLPVTAAGGGSFEAAEVMVDVTGAPVGSRAVSTEPGSKETKHQPITIATTTTSAAQISAVLESPEKTAARNKIQRVSL